MTPKESSNSNLQLLPIHNRWQGRFFPLSFGRRELVSWWWQACPCEGTKSRRPCQECRTLSAITQLLSKSMFQIQSNGLIQISPSNRNPSLLWINGEQACNRGDSWRLQAKDLLSIGKSPKQAWMTFIVHQSATVTPEVETFISTRSSYSSTPKRALFKSTRPLSRDEGAKNDRETRKTPLNEPAKRRLYPRKRQVQTFDESGQNESENKRIADNSQLRQQVDKVSFDQHTTKLRRPKKRKLPLSSSPEIEGDERREPKRTTKEVEDQEVQESIGRASNEELEFGQNGPVVFLQTRALERQHLLSQGSLHALEEKAHFSQEEQAHPHTQQPSMKSVGPSDQSSLLSLPQCYTMASQDHRLSQSSSEGAVVHEPSQQQETNEASTKRGKRLLMAKELTMADWKELQNGGHYSRFHQALASIVVGQRIRRQDDGWLPNLLQH